MSDWDDGQEWKIGGKSVSDYTIKKYFFDQSWWPWNPDVVDDWYEEEGKNLELYWMTPKIKNLMRGFHWDRTTIDEVIQKWLKEREEAFYKWMLADSVLDDHR